MATLAAAAQGGRSLASSSSSTNLGGGSQKRRKGWLARLLKAPGSICRNHWGTPIFVTASAPIELFFFQRVFDSLCEQTLQRKLIAAQAAQDSANPSRQESSKSSDVLKRTRTTSGDKPKKTADLSSFDSDATSEVREVPLVQFHRAMVRMFKILQQPSILKRLQDPAAVVDVTPPNSVVDANKDGKVGWYEFCSFWKDNERLISVNLSFAERLFLTLEDAERSFVGRIMSVIMFIAIIISTGSFIVSTVPDFQSKCILEGQPGHDPSCKPQSDQTFKDLDVICVLFFCLEYGLRLILSSVMRTELVDRDRQKLLSWMVSEETMQQPSCFRRAWVWFSSPANLIDLCAIMPWFLTKAFEGSGGGDSMIIRLIRLTRVIRAIRLGKKFEAVIIVVRSVRRSMRALYVLVLNLLLGVITFGAFMYFCEQGTWDAHRKAYMRPEGELFNNVTKTWEVVYGRSPFESIPACFWWAIVTATTVGYGDMYPTTKAGKAVAGLAMGWSLCVLALPIGVIGGNFHKVWEEYDKEKDNERMFAQKEEMMLKRSIAWGDPLHYSRLVVLEVWHDAGLSDGGEQAEFMGEVEQMLEMPPEECVRRKFTIPLTPNLDKARRRVHGHLTFEYTWRPHGHADKCGDSSCSPRDSTGSVGDALLTGALEVLVCAGEDLIAIDWKGTCSSDPYVVVKAYPRSPGPDGRLCSETFRTDTVWDTQNPSWNSKAKFDVQWTQTGTEHRLAADMRQLGEETDVDMDASRKLPKQQAASAAENVLTTDRDREEFLEHMVPSLQEEIVHLQKFIVPQLKSSILDVKQDLKQIADALRQRNGPPREGRGSVHPSSSRHSVASSEILHPRR